MRRDKRIFLNRLITTESSFCGKKEKGNAGEWDEKYRKEREDFRPEKMDLGHNELLLWKDKKDETPCAALPYREMLFVYLERKTEVKGVVQIPPVEEITGEMEGNLVIWNRTHRCIRLDLSSQKETAGALFIRLAEHIPFAFLGATPWMQVENEQDFQEMVRMVDLYQEIHGGTCL